MLFIFFTPTMGSDSKETVMKNKAACPQHRLRLNGQEVQLSRLLPEGY